MIADSCREFRRSLLVGQLEGEHSATCDACRRFRDRELHAAALIREVYADEHAPTALRNRISAAVEAARAHRASGSRRVDRRALAAGAMLAVAAGVAIAIIESGGAEPSAKRVATVVPHSHLDESGAVGASGSRHVELGGAAADLDPGATVTWRRDGDMLVVAQAGAARWLVGDGTQLRIEAAAMSAAVTATGASLRVEVPMNVSDVRIFGTTVLTAAAVAFVTVVVYEGHVVVKSGDQTVNVEPGTTVELRPDKPPAPPQVVGAKSSPDELRMKLRILDLEAQVQQLEADNQHLADNWALRPGKPAVTVSPSHAVAPPATDHCDEVSCVLTNYSGACCAKFKSPPSPDGALPRELDHVIIADGIAPVKARALECAQHTSAKGTVKVHVAVGSDGSVTDARVVQTPDPALGACVSDALKAASFAKTQNGGTFTYPFVF